MTRTVLFSVFIITFIACGVYYWWYAAPSFDSSWSTIAHAWPALECDGQGSDFETTRQFRSYSMNGVVRVDILTTERDRQWGSHAVVEGGSAHIWSDDPRVCIRTRFDLSDVGWAPLARSSTCSRRLYLDPELFSTARCKHIIEQ